MEIQLPEEYSGTKPLSKKNRQAAKACLLKNLIIPEAS